MSASRLTAKLPVGRRISIVNTPSFEAPLGRERGGGGPGHRLQQSGAGLQQPGGPSACHCRSDLRDGVDPSYTIALGDPLPRLHEAPGLLKLNGPAEQFQPKARQRWRTRRRTPRSCRYAPISAARVLRPPRAAHGLTEMAATDDLVKLPMRQSEEARNVAEPVARQTRRPQYRILKGHGQRGVLFPQSRLSPLVVFGFSQGA